VRGTCPTCEAAVDLFVGLYGAQAGNLALTAMALGGVYVGGGIVTKLLPKVASGLFMEAFRDAGRFEPLLREIPVWVILDPKTSLLGAAQVALDLTAR
jgi:glucokinase